MFARDSMGAPIYVVVVKATFSFAGGGELQPIAPQPIVERDVYAGDPATSGLLRAAELGLPKPRVDVLLAGALRFKAPMTESIARLEVGRRIDKRVALFGDRHWLPGVLAELAPSRVQPVMELPIAWERTAGGGDLEDPGLTDRRNPAGCTAARTAPALHGKPLPNFETPLEPTTPTAWKSRPAPIGLGPVAGHWEPRSGFAGTYDARWKEQRAPLLPEDFDPAFFNCAPADQQLAGYMPGEEVRLTGMTTSGYVRVSLPELVVPVTFVLRDVIEERRARVDTVVIEPAEERLSVVARAACAPRPAMTAVREAFVGPLTRGRRKALELGKPFLDLRSLPRRKGPA
jgi:hypothetical protein